MGPDIKLFHLVLRLEAWRISVPETGCSQSLFKKSLATPYKAPLYRMLLQFHQSSTESDRGRVQNEWESMELNG